MSCSTRYCAMSDDNEIEFESVDSQTWGGVKAQATTIAFRNLQGRYNAAVSAGIGFRKDAHEYLGEAIKKPPGSLLSFGPIADLVVVACGLVLPEVGVVALVFEEAKKALEVVKPSEELASKATEQFEANTVDDAIKHLDELCEMLEDDIVRNALTITDSASNKVADALEEYVKENPQDFTTLDDAYYQTLCDAIGVTKPNVDWIADQIINKVM